MRMPLSMAQEGECNTIRKVGGKEETRRFLEKLGFVAGRSEERRVGKECR